MFLAVCVVFCTTYALILPAITLHNEGPMCGMSEIMRHEHTEECENMVCTLAEHTHDEFCSPVYEKSLLWENDSFEIHVTTSSETAIPMKTQLQQPFFMV